MIEVEVEVIIIILIIIGCKVDPPPSGASWTTFLTAK